MINNVAKIDKRFGKVKCDNLAGKRFGRLLVIERAQKREGRREAYWHCICDCGKHTTVCSLSLKNGATKSCGCIHREGLIARNTKHGDTISGKKSFRLYHVWANMKNRCHNPNNVSYKNYGGRGIVVCDEWRNNYVAFRKWAMLNGYDPIANFAESTIDRIDNNGSYTPSNCRFVSFAIQATNKRHPKSRRVSQYNQDGFLIRSWGGSFEIKNELGYDRSCISRACTGQMKLAYGYVWQYED